MTALTSMSMRVIFRRKEFDSCSLFRNLVFIPTIAENPTSQMYEDGKGSSTFKASVERVGHVCLNRQPELCLSSLWSLSNPESVQYTGEGGDTPYDIRRILCALFFTLF
jgi:hypothetical protein